MNKIRSIKSIQTIKAMQSIHRKRHPEVVQYLSLMKPFLFPNHSIIPRHVYTCWHTKDLPPLMQQNYNHIVRNNPEMQVHLYDETECRSFIETHFHKDVVEAYDTLVPCSYKSDLWRFCVLYIQGGIYVDIKYKDSAYPKYWNSHYRIEAVVNLQNLLEATMTEATFKKIHQPTLALYYYKDEARQDNVVKVSAIQKMMQQIATPANLKMEMAMPNTGNHVIASPIVSNDIVSVEKATAKFMKDIIIKE